MPNMGAEMQERLLNLKIATSKNIGKYGHLIQSPTKKMMVIPHIMARLLLLHQFHFYQMMIQVLHLLL